MYARSVNSWRETRDSVGVWCRNRFPVEAELEVAGIGR